MIEHHLAGRLGMFAKYWAPGAVKTRLAAEVGPAAAAAIHRAFVEHLAWRWASSANDRELWCAPDDSLDLWRDFAGQWKIVPQGPGDLGVRMARFFAAGDLPAVLVGSDSPNLPPERMREAFAGLRRSPVVLGPADDGGYYLIGLARPMPEVFRDMPWSQPGLWRATLGRLEEIGVRPAVLPTWYDVDHPADWRRLLDDLRGFLSPWDERLRRQLQRIPEAAAWFESNHHPPSGGNT